MLDSGTQQLESAVQWLGLVVLLLHGLPAIYLVRLVILSVANRQINFMLVWPSFDMLCLDILVAYLWPSSIFWTILAYFSLFLA